MFKIIPGNDKYIVSLTQEFRDLNGNVVEMPPDKSEFMIVNGSLTVCITVKKLMDGKLRF